MLGLVLLVLGAIFIRNPGPVQSSHSAGVGGFFSSVINAMLEVAKIGHVWVASIAGAATFGAMLALGVVWAPKLLMVHGISKSSANFHISVSGSAWRQAVP